MIVVDASVAAKCYIAEKDSDKAIKLITGIERLIAPELIGVEVAAAICKRVRLGELQPDEALLRCVRWRGHLGDEVINTVSNRELLEDAERLAVDLRHPIQDCLYLALARRQKASLVTADEVFLKRAAGIHAGLELLSTFPGF